MDLVTENQIQKFNKAYQYSDIKSVLKLLSTLT